MILRNIGSRSYSSWMTNGSGDSRCESWSTGAEESQSENHFSGNSSWSSDQASSESWSEGEYWTWQDDWSRMT